MPVPKRKTSKSRRDMRQSCKFIRVTAITHCSNCSFALTPHKACTLCGHYKGRKVFAGTLDKKVKRMAAQHKAAQSNTAAGSRMSGSGDQE
jgi:large subunit ribosomal protein L32